MKENIKFKITSEVYNKLKEKIEVASIFDNNIPFKRFEIVFPSTTHYDEEHWKKEGYNKEVTKELLRSDIVISVEIKDAKAIPLFNITKSIKATTYMRLGDKQIKVFEWETNPLTFIPTNVAFNEFNTNGDGESVRQLNVIVGIIKLLNNTNKDKIKVKVDRVKKAKKRGKKGKPKKGNNVTYITNKVYTLDNVDVVDFDEKRVYNKHVDSFGVRGHWRRLKSGKKVWIDGYTKGNKDVGSMEKTYKINKI